MANMADEDRMLVVRNALMPMVEKGVTPAPRIFGTSDEKIITPMVFLRLKHNFYSLTVCSLEQYLQNSSENKILLS